MRAFVSQQTQWLQAYYSGIGKTAVIFPAAFFVAVAMGQLTLGIVLYARLVLGASGTRIGMLAGIWSLTYVAGCLLLRPLFNRAPPRYLIVGSTATMMAIVFAMMVLGSFSALLALYACFGVALSLFWPPMMGWMSTEFEGSELGRVTARYNFSWCSGNVISPFLCGWLSAMDPRYPLFFAAILLLLVSVFVLGASMALPRIRGDRMTGSVHDAAPGTRDRSCALRYPAWMGLFASFFAMGVLVAVLPMVALQAWGGSEKAVGVIFTGRGLMNVVGFLWLGRFHGWHFRRAPMVAGQWLGALAFGAMAWFDSITGAAVFVAVFGLSGAMSYSASLFHGVAGSLNRARRMAIHESVLAGGLVCGSVAGGWLYEQMAPAALFAVVALGLAGMTVLQAMVARKVTAEPATPLRI